MRGLFEDHSEMTLAYYAGLYYKTSVVPSHSIFLYLAVRRYDPFLLCLPTKWSRKIWILLTSCLLLCNAILTPTYEGTICSCKPYRLRPSSGLLRLISLKVAATTKAACLVILEDRVSTRKKLNSSTEVRSVSFYVRLRFYYSDSLSSIVRKAFLHLS